jgi:hypothetical protein
MTAFDYARPLATANRLIERYGQLGAVRVEGEASGPSYDPEPGEPEDHPARFVMIEFDAGEIDGTRILATDKKALLAPGSLAITPSTDHHLVEADGTVWNIVPPVQTLRPAETTLLFTLQVRR